MADSTQVALSIRNLALGASYCLAVTQVNHCIVPYAQMPNTQLPKQPFFI